MDFDVYCAICGGPLREVIVSNPNYVKPHRTQAELEHMMTSLKNFARQVQELGSQEQRNNANRMDEAVLDEKIRNFVDHVDDDPGDPMYDGTILEIEDVRWVKRVHCLGSNLEENDDGETYYTRAYISGEGEYQGDGCLSGDLDSTTDPNFDADTEYTCYAGTSEPDINPVFPFHRPCMEILQHRIMTLYTQGGGQPKKRVLWSATALRETEDYRDKTHRNHPDALFEHFHGDALHENAEDISWSVNKDVLYSVMLALSGDNSLNIDYGHPAIEHEEMWDIKQGEEFLVSRPLPPNHFCDDLTIKAAKQVFENCLAAEPMLLASGASLVPKVRQDPFRRLSFDILHCIFEHIQESVSSDNLSSFARASFYANLALRDVGPGFWRAQYIRSMPAFMELHLCFPPAGLTPAEDLKKHASAESLSSQQLRRLYSAARSVIRWPEVNHIKDKWLLGVANRARVWEAAGQIADAYNQAMREGSA